jgi:hypothetical protein
MVNGLLTTSFTMTADHRPQTTTPFGIRGLRSAVRGLFVLFSLFILPASTLHSQVITIPLDDTTANHQPYIAPYQKFSFGLRAGLNIAQIFGTGSQVFNHFGFSGGFRFGYRFADKFSFNPELLYNMKGAARYPNIDKGDYYSFSVDLDYIEVPLLFNFYFGKRQNFSFEFGPSIGFLVRQKAYENQSPINTTSTGFNVYDISLTVGLNYYLPKGFGLNFRFMNSIAPIQPTYGTLPWGVSSISIGQLNSVINFSFFYKFDLRSKEQKLLDGDVKEKPVKEKKKKKEKGDVVDEDE